MSQIELRDYQSKFIDGVKKSLEKGESVCGVAPCGAGKTVMAAQLVKDIVSNGGSVIFMVHRKELLEQTAETFKKFDIPISIIAADSKTDYSQPVKLAMVQTLVNRVKYIPAPDLIICDECHHILADSYMAILNEWDTSKLLGLTATPERYGGVRLGETFTTMIETPSLGDLIEMGYLTKLKYYATANALYLDNIKIVSGDYKQDDLAKVMNTEKLVGDIVEHYIEKANDTQALCYCVNIEHSETICQRFNEAGINAVHIDHETPKPIREQYIRDFRNKDIKILCNVNLFGEGLDVPGVQTVIMARPTRSLTLYIQQSTRGLRLDPDNPEKISIILDHARNIEEHGLPDSWYKWSLAENPKKDKAREVPPFKECPVCHTCSPIATKICPECDYEFPIEAEIPKESKEHLVEIPHSKVTINERFNSYKQICQTKGYKPAWLKYQLVKDVASAEDCIFIAEKLNYKKGWGYYLWNYKVKLWSLFQKARSKKEFLAKAPDYYSGTTLNFARNIAETLFNHWQRNPQYFLSQG